MAREKKATDEQIIAALLNTGTLRAAAAAVGISERAIYDRMSTGEFQALYKAAKADIIRAVVFNINNRLQEAVNTIADIMQDPGNSPAVRLQAAQTILNNVWKFAQRLQDEETDTLTQFDNNRFVSR